MEILVHLKKFEDHLAGDELDDDIAEQVKRHVSRIEIHDVKEENIGPGADLYVFLLVVYGLGKLFLSGEKINANLKGWIELAKQLRDWHKSKELVSVDLDGARALALLEISEHFTLERLSERSNHFLPMVDFSQPHTFGDGRKEGDLISHPHGYYTLVYDVNDDYTLVIGVTTKGDVHIVKSFESVSPYSLIEKSLPPKRIVD